VSKIDFSVNVSVNLLLLGVRGFLVNRSSILLIIKAPIRRVVNITKDGALNSKFEAREEM